jgi:hypothetical protein
MRTRELRRALRQGVSDLRKGDTTRAMDLIDLCARLERAETSLRRLRRIAQQMLPHLEFYRRRASDEEESEQEELEQDEP